MWIQILLLLPIASAISDLNITNPVVLIPGDGGNQLLAKLNKSSAPHRICQTQTDWFRLWLDVTELIDIYIDCWIDNAKLNYDNVTRTTYNQPGVQIKVPSWGGTESLEYVDPNPLIKFIVGKYFNDIVDALVNKGWERNVTLRGAPFDFRKAPNEMEEYFTNLKQLIEETYHLSGDKQVILIAHSMGAPLSHYFLTHQSQPWKEKYIKSLISLSGAWGGSFKSYKIFFMGDDLGVFLLGEKLKNMEITMPSIAWLLPRTNVWSDTDILATTPKKNYTMANLKEYFYDIGYETGWEMAKDQSQYWDLSPPGVEVHCLFGQIPNSTPEKMIFSEGEVPSGYPKIEKGDGDSTVNARSLRVCERWENVHSKEFLGSDHQSMLHDEEVLQHIMEIITGK